MRQVLEEILSTETVRAPGGKPLSLRDHISLEEGEFLGRLVEEIAPDRSLEIGLAYGISGLFICDALPESAIHYALDPLQEELWENAGLETLRRAGLRDHVEFIQERSEFALPRLASEGLTIGFAFIDGMHVFDHALLDFFYVDRMLRPGGVVAFDDADLPAVRRVVRYVLTNRDYAVKACLESDAPPRRAAGRALERLAATGPGGRIAKPELRRSDRSLGLIPSTRCAALVKLSDDSRAWNFNADF